VLTARESEVAVLVASGLTDAEIGETLGIKRCTVWRHVSNILAKLQARNRAQIAAHVGALAMLVLAAS
jgi:DNA-binding NarL/FixJ family response regulator